MSKGQFGARDLHKHLWKLPIPGFDPARELHVTIVEAGATAAARAAEKLADLREKRRDKLTVTIVRRELRNLAPHVGRGQSCGDSREQTAG